MAIDQFGRKIHYLRISLTDHCNLRCIYCMPEDQTFRPNPDLMQDDGIHPNAKAQPKLLENVWPHLQPLVEG